ncbi:GNAT family N-acetyltransferase [Luteimicrobium sp. DT211]|uniref:GNAT family N-acetyltransferase n=1 Tax=Luteimicrobium sp. DT211 TaxID=3393412 RepID=UPI003CF750B4
MPPEVLARGPRVVLRGWAAADRAVLREWLRPEHEWHRSDGPYYPVPSDDEAAAIAEGAGRSPGPGLPPGRLVIDVDGRLVGAVSWYWESEETQWARMGVTVFDPAERGRGLGREALALWTSYLFGATDWVRLDLATWSGNAAMIAVARALGFVEEGRFRRARVVDGTRYDAVVLGVLREEWEATRKEPA